MSIFTEKDFKMIAQGYLLKDILKDHIENYEEVYKFYTAFIKDWNNSVDSRITLLKGLNHIYDTFVANPSTFYLYSGNNVRIQVFVKRSINNLPELKLKGGELLTEGLQRTYPDLKKEVIQAIRYWFDNTNVLTWATFCDIWNTSLKYTSDTMILEHSAFAVPKSKLTLSFPKKYLIGEYDD